MTVRADDARKVAGEVEAAGGQGAVVGFDVVERPGGDRGDQGRSASRARQLDILVNNAGIAINGLIMRFTDEQWAKTLLDVNLTGAFHCHPGGRDAPAQGQGSAAGSSTSRRSSARWATAARPPTRRRRPASSGSPCPRRASWPRAGVTCNAVAPGYIETDMTAEHLPEAQRAKLLEQIPLGRIGQADDVADAVAFLAGPEAAYITGQVLRVNGGLLM